MPIRRNRGLQRSLKFIISFNTATIPRSKNICFDSSTISPYHYKISTIEVIYKGKTSTINKLKSLKVTECRDEGWWWRWWWRVWLRWQWRLLMQVVMKVVWWRIDFDFLWGYAFRQTDGQTDRQTFAIAVASMTETMKILFQQVWILSSFKSTPSPYPVLGIDIVEVIV